MMAEGLNISHNVGKMCRKSRATNDGRADILTLGGKLHRTTRTMDGGVTWRSNQHHDVMEIIRRFVVLNKKYRNLKIQGL